METQTELHEACQRFRTFFSALTAVDLESDELER